MTSEVDSLVKEYADAVNRIVAMLDPGSVLQQCRTTMNKRIKLPIRLPRVVALARRIVESLDDALTNTLTTTAINLGVQEVIAPVMSSPCIIRLRRYGIRGAPIRIVNGEDVLWVNDERVGGIAFLNIDLRYASPTTSFVLPIAYYTQRDADVDVSPSGFFEDFMLLSLFVVENPWFTEALARTIEEVLGNKATGGEAIAEARNVANTVRKELEILKAVGESALSQ